MQTRALILGVSFAALTAGMSVAVAKADDADQPVATATPVNESTTVAPLTITAERRTVNLQTAPIAASVIPGNVLQDEGIQNLDDLQFHTPSLVVADFGQGALFNIRGVGKDLTNVQTPSGVVTYYDGVATYPGFFLNAPYYDIANIEVLRGPQGTFAGQNATGGAVFITTADPSLGRVGGDIEAQYGSYSDGLLRGFINVPVSDTLAIRIAFNGELRDTFYKVTGPYTTPSGRQPGALDAGSVRVSVLWQPTVAFRAVLKFNEDYVDNGGYLGDLATAVVGGRTVPNPADPFKISSFTDDYGTNKGTRVTLNATYTLPDGIALKSITGYQYAIGNNNIDLTEVFPTAAFEDYGRESIFSQEINVVSPDNGPLRWVGGLYYQHDYVSLIPGGGQPGFDIHLPGFEDELLLYHTPKVTEAVFGQVSYDLTAALQLQVGARYTDETFGLQDTAIVTCGPLGVFIGCAPSDVSFAAHTEHQRVTGKVALNWTLDPNNFLYAFAALGSKAAGINTTPVGSQAAPVPFGPEQVIDYEIGWKPTFFNGHLRAQFDGYYDQYTNFQLSFAVPLEPTENFIQNVGGTTIMYGVEAEAQAVFGALSLDGAASYEHSRLGSAVVLDPGPSPTAGLAIALGGRPVPLAPAWTLSAGAQYAFAFGNGGTLTPRIDYSYTSGQWATPYEDIGDFLDARNLVNAEVAYAQGPYKITVYATNAFNLHYIIATNIGLRYAGAPGQYGVRVERRF